MLMSDTLGWNLSLAPGLSVKNAFLYLIFAAIAIETALARNRRLEMMTVIVPYVLLITYAIFNWLVMIFIVRNPQYSTLGTAINLKGGLVDHILVFLVFFYGVLKSDDAVWLIKSFVWTIVVVNILSVIDFFNVPNLDLVFEIDDARMRGPIGEPNQYASFLLVFLPAMVAFAISERGLRRGLMLIGLGFSAIALLTTASRGGFLGLLAGSLVAIFYLRAHISGRALSRALVGFLFLGLIGVVILLLTGTYDATFGRAIGQTTIGNVYDASSGRTLLWAEALEKMFLAPITLISGFGWEAYRQLFDFRLAPHNSYLKILFELGLIGLTLLIVTYVNMIAVVRKSLSKTQGFVHSLLLAFIFGLISYLVSIFFVDIHSPWLFVWAFAGTIMRVVANQSAQENQKVSQYTSSSVRVQG